MKTYRTDQESFWAGEFGSVYVTRNPDTHQAIAQRTAFWVDILRAVTHPIGSLLELGANIGINLDALGMLLPQTELHAIEINSNAVEILRSKPRIQVYHNSIVSFVPERQWDFVFTSGVLIHLNPEVLPNVYALMAQSASRYICMAEYYNPSPVEVPYRGHSGKLFKRDFAGEFMQAYPEFRLQKYGFVYHKDPQFPADDITWFLLEKENAA